MSGQPIVSVDGKAVTLPKNLDIISASVVGKYIIASTHFGVKVIWDGDDSLYIKVIRMIYDNLMNVCSP